MRQGEDSFMRPIRVLIIEDSEEDAGILLQELQRGGYAPSYARVATADGIMAALERQTWDALFTNYATAQLNALAALEAIRNRKLDLPCFVLSDALNAEAVGELMRAGAHDCIWKGDYTRLLPALDRELRQATLRHEHRRAGQALRDSEAVKLAEHHYRTTIDSIEDALHLVDSDLRVVLANRTLLRWNEELGLGTDIVGKSVFEIYPFLSDKPRQEYRQVFATGQVIVTEESNQVGDRILITETRKIPVFEKGGVVRVVTVIRNITDRKRDERQLREQAALLDKAQDAIIVTGLTGPIVYWNKRAERLYGYTVAEAQGRDLDSLLSPPHAAPKPDLRSAVLAESEWMGELAHITKDRRIVTVQSRWTLVRDDAGNPQSVLVINTDVTQQKELEIKFLRAQRMESIGTLASGLAHDLNNVLAPILMALQTLKQDIHDDANQLLLNTLETSALRGANIIKQLLTFGRGIEGERIVLEPRYLIREMIKIAQETFPKTIQVKVNNPNNLWAVKSDPTQLHQVLLNLCLNARDAMPDGGQLTITAENAQLDDSYTRMNPEAKVGPYIMIAVSDTGRGIPADLFCKIFEPFFTTKAVGKGSGLGLATALGIVKSHGGFMQVTSEVGRGAQFKVYLPAVTTTPAQIAKPEPASPSAGAGELILIVEDELPVRQVTEITLIRNGYRVLTAADGADAVALFVQNQGAIDLVLTDMAMPFMDGAATIRALRKIKPTIKIVAISGIPAQTPSGKATLASVQAFLLKPFTAEQLLVVLKKALAGAGNPPPTLTP